MINGNQRTINGGSYKNYYVHGSYNASKTYVPRTKEIIEDKMMGKLRIKKGQKTGAKDKDERYI